MPGIWVVGKAFKNTPGDNNSLVLKASLLEKRRCTESSQLLSLSGTFGVMQLYPYLLDKILLA